MGDGIKFRADAAGSWDADPVASHAACQLDEVEAILSNDQEKKYKMTLKDSNGSEACVVNLASKPETVMLEDPETNLRGAANPGSF